MKNGSMKLSKLTSQYETYLRGGLMLADTSIKNRMCCFRRFLVHFETIGDLDLPSIRAYIANLRGELSDNSVGQHVICLRTFCEFLVEEGLLQTNPARKIKAPSHRCKYDIEVLTPEEIEGIINAPIQYTIRGRKPDLKGTITKRLVHATLAYTGARSSEIINLKVSDLNFLTNTIRIRKNKTSTPCLIPLPINIKDELAELVRSKEPDEYVFQSLNGSKLHKNLLLLDMKKRAELVGIRKRVYLHLYRDSYATILRKSGAELDKIQRLLNHKSIQTTTKYTHLVIEDLEKEVKRYHPAMRKHQKPQEVLQDLADIIHSSGLTQDSRFSTCLKIEGSTLEFKVTPKSPQRPKQTK